MNGNPTPEPTQAPTPEEPDEKKEEGMKAEDKPA